MTFKEYLQNSTNGETPEADFAADAIRDKSFRDFKSWDELETYLIFHRACPEALVAGKKCYHAWMIKYGNT